MGKTIRYSTPEYQVKKLESQNLSVEDRQSAEKILSTIGYSKLIKSYRQPYIIRKGEDIDVK
ncbi:MAG: hypothetical protein IJ682_01080 [Lachnospiraceae bacterium]|nr:hypothetical protein [Lachnospiraceae bacterium]